MTAVAASGERRLTVRRSDLLLGRAAALAFAREGASVVVGAFHGPISRRTTSKAQGKPTLIYS
jgi:NAD(P)-dependent dehydrogenase (short-subunit alcohol dehydrogenase family)